MTEGQLFVIEVEKHGLMTYDSPTHVLGHKALSPNLKAEVTKTLDDKCILSFLSIVTA